MFYIQVLHIEHMVKILIEQCVSDNFREQLWVILLDRHVED